MYGRIEKFGRPLAVVMIVGLCAVWAYAEKKLPSEVVSEPGFVRIFNGKDLSGWDGDPRLWSVRDDAIRGKTTIEKLAIRNTFLIWRGGKLKNFILKIKFRIRNGNSGIQYRSCDLGNWRVAGYQAEVENKQGKVGFLYDEQGRGWIARVGEFMVVDEKGTKRVVGKVADRNALIKAGYYKDKDWNEYTIIARGNHLVHILNGYQTIEVLDNDPKGRAMEGILALQIHAGLPMTVEFKDIRIRHLKANYGEAIRLFNGKNLDGWMFSSDSLKDAWSVRDGVMVNRGKPTGYIRTKGDFTNFVLRLQFRHLEKGNSGVLLRMVGEDKVWPRSIEAQGLYGNAGDIWNIDNFPMKTDPGRTEGGRTLKMHDSNEKPIGQWNQYEITLDGGNLEIKVNELVQNTATQCWETPGKICIQAEGAKMEYRNIVLIPIIRGKDKASGGTACCTGAADASITTRLRNDDITEVRIASEDGKIVKTYELNLSQHHSPATEKTPALKKWESYKFGAFVCFNSNQFTGKEICQTRDPKVYNPTNLNVGGWTDAIKKAGMKYAVLTTRHSSGFLLWDSPTTDFDIGSSGNRTDVVKEFTDNCRKQGIAPGLYYCMWGGEWHSNPNARAIILAQLYELATQYGEIPYFWIDMMNWAPKELSAQEVYDLLKNLQPNTIVILNQHVQDGTKIKYFPTDILNGEVNLPPDKGHQPFREVGGIKYYLPFEFEPVSQGMKDKSYVKTPCGPGCWFTYGAGRSFPASYPLPAEDLRKWVEMAYERGASNVLISLAPDYTGSMREEDVKQLEQLGRLLEEELKKRSGSP